MLTETQTLLWQYSFFLMDDPSLDPLILYYYTLLSIAQQKSLFFVGFIVVILPQYVLLISLAADIVSFSICTLFLSLYICVYVYGLYETLLSQRVIAAFLSYSLRPHQSMTNQLLISPNGKQKIYAICATTTTTAITTMTRTAVKDSGFKDCIFFF